MHVINVMAMSVDARIAASSTEKDDERSASGFTNQDDRDHLLGLLATADAVVVGSRSLLASGGAFETRNAAGKVPIWVVVTNRGLPPEAHFWRQSQVPRWLASATSLTIPDHLGAVSNLVYGDSPAAAHILQALAAAGAQRVLLFGGGEVNQLFYAAGLVDELWLTVCPIILGGKTSVPLISPPLANRIHLTLKASQARGDLVFLNYTVLHIR